MKICCANCHNYLDDCSNCQGLKDVENDYCHEYRETLYKKQEEKYNCINPNEE